MNVCATHHNEIPQNLDPKKGNFNLFTSDLKFWKADFKSCVRTKFWPAEDKAKNFRHSKNKHFSNCRRLAGTRVVVVLEFRLQSVAIQSCLLISTHTHTHSMVIQVRRKFRKCSCLVILVLGNVNWSIDSNQCVHFQLKLNLVCMKWMTQYESICLILYIHTCLCTCSTSTTGHTCTDSHLTYSQICKIVAIRHARFSVTKLISAVTTLVSRLMCKWSTRF